MSSHPILWSKPILPTLAASLISFSSPASSTEFKVTNDGQDGPTCGSTSNPCRSISQAIENASDGDSITVGAGLYGNISGNANFGGPGDEHPSVPVGTTGCLICITKAVSITSLHGAAVTVIQGNAGSSFQSNVLILHDGVVFGEKGGGFTITGGNADGLTIMVPYFPQPSVTRTITVAGNVDVNDTSGFYFFGRQFFQVEGCPPGVCILTAKMLLSDNVAVNNSAGFTFDVNTDGGPGPLIVQNNVAIGAGTGFLEIPGGTFTSAVNAPASIVQLTGNVATLGGIGFATNLSGPIVGNTASANSQAGFIVTPNAAQEFRSNSAIGNAGPGVIVNFSPDPFTVQYGAFASFSGNNLYGNDRNRPMLAVNPAGHPISIGPNQLGYNPGPGAHCGVLNVGALAALTPQSGPLPPPPVIQLQATNNFWGSNRGPQATGAGDAVGGACDQNGGVTVGKPFATTAYPITTSP